MTGVTFRPPPIYFMHVPKTAGMSLSSMLGSIYGLRQSLAIRHPSQLRAFTVAELKSFRHIDSHFGPGLFSLVWREGMLGITMLRDPVERVVSHIYSHQRFLERRGKAFAPDYLARMNPLIRADLRAWLERCDGQSIVANLQTRHLGDHFDYRPYLKDEQTGKAKKKLRWPEQYAEYSDCSSLCQVAARARKQIEDLAVVGITERFAESAALICAELGVHPPAEVPVANAGTRRSGRKDRRRYRESIPPELVERIEELNRNDIELYRCACELFRQRWSHFQSQPRRTYCILPELRMALAAPVRRTWQAMDRRWPDFARNEGVQRVRRVARRIL